MAQNKIIWSQRAKIRLLQILEFYANRNKSKTYSAQLYLKFKSEIKLLQKHPDIGIKTNLENIRGLIIDEYIVYYEKIGTTVCILTIWSSVQNPDNLTIK